MGTKEFDLFTPKENCQVTWFQVFFSVHFQTFRLMECFLFLRWNVSFFFGRAKTQAVVKDRQSPVLVLPAGVFHFTLSFSL